MVAVGVLVGSALAGAVPRLLRFGRWLAADFLLLGFGQAFLGEARTLAVACTAMAVGGFVYGPYETRTATYIQQAVRAPVLGRVFGACTALLGVGVPIGALVTGILAPFVGSRGLLLGSGAADAVLTLIAIGIPAMRALPTLHLGEAPPASSPSLD